MLFFGFGGGQGSPDIPKPAPPPPPIEDEEAARKLAAQRRSLEGKRRGRGSLVIEPTTNPGISSGAVTTGGIRIPRP